MVYYFIGQPGSGKTTLGKKLYNFLKTEKETRNFPFKNWRSYTFHVDGDGLRELYQNKDYTEEGRRKNITNAQGLIKYLHTNKCNVVVSIVTPYLDLRESFKKELGCDIVEILVHTTEKRERDHYHVKDFEYPESNFIDIDTTEDSPELSFSRILTELIKLDKL